MRIEDHWPGIDLPLPSPPAEFPPQEESKIPSLRLLQLSFLHTLCSVRNTYLIRTVSQVRLGACGLVAICDLSS